jgi:hypothetical protein
MGLGTAAKAVCVIVALGAAVAAFACGGEADLGSASLAKNRGDSGLNEASVVEGYIGPARPQLAGVGQPRDPEADPGIHSWVCPTSVEP